MQWLERPVGGASIRALPPRRMSAARPAPPRHRLRVIVQAPVRERMPCPACCVPRHAAPMMRGVSAVNRYVNRALAGCAQATAEGVAGGWRGRHPPRQLPPRMSGSPSHFALPDVHGAYSPRNEQGRAGGGRVRPTRRRPRLFALAQRASAKQVFWYVRQASTPQCVAASGEPPCGVWTACVQRREGAGGR